MTPILENAALGSALDAQNFRILNLSRLLPVPTGLVDIDDAKLSDQRAILDGTVTDESVSVVAAIAQDKLDFNDDMPVAWIGTAANQAAPGDTVERVANKGIAGGYVALDSNGLLPSANVTAGVGAGTVNSVYLAMPSVLEVTGNPITDSGSFTVDWADQADKSWFGVNGFIGPTPTLVPSFITSEIPIEIVPDLDAAKFTTGTFDVDRLPVAVEMGVDHAPGAVPDPGLDGDENDYLGRDMEWHPFVQNVDYQPTVPATLITLNSYFGDDWSVTVRSILSGSTLFYRVNGGDFIEVVPISPASISITLTLALDDFVEAYASKAGYNNSPITAFKVAIPVPPIP